MTTLDWTPSLIDEPEAPAHRSLRLGTVHKLSDDTTVRMAVNESSPVIVFVTGQIDLACADELSALLCMAVDAYPQGLEVDLAAVSFCDCRGLRALLTARASARRRGRYFALGAHSPIVARLLELTDTRAMLTTVH